MSNPNVKFIYKHIQKSLFQTKIPTSTMRAGSMRTKEAVLEALKTALTNSPIPREELAKELSRLVGEEVSVHAINNWCAEGKGNRRFPLEFAKAVALITGDRRLIDAALTPEFETLSADGKVFYEYGREVMEGKMRSKKRTELEKLAVKAIEKKELYNGNY